VIKQNQEYHPIMSYFDVDLNVITLLEGERRVNEPIHNSIHYKELKKDILEIGIDSISCLLKRYI
jgi:hypothetical protein